MGFGLCGGLVGGPHNLGIIVSTHKLHEFGEVRVKNLFACIFHHIVKVSHIQAVAGEALFWSWWFSDC